MVDHIKGPNVLYGEGRTLNDVPAFAKIKSTSKTYEN
jgi:hypothetical protein